ncbi:MAG: GDSL-type esterase/lipase family protein [Cyclobacteriaceae bacterium]
MRISIAALLLLCLSTAQAQQVIPLYSGKAPGSEKWDWQEAEMYSDDWQTRVVYNVSTPTLTAYLPPAATANGTAVVICPGGAFHALSIDTEGIDVAKWLSSKGVATFVLKYRLVKSETPDPVKEVSLKMADGKKFGEATSQLIPMAVADGLEAIKYVRKNAGRFKVNPERIGMIGFSAGGTITTGVTLNGSGETRPDFVAPIYAYIPPSMKDIMVPENAPPMFVAAATDDNLGLAPHSVALYNKWLEAGKPAELHLYANGGHGFGMRMQNYPSDSWIDRFGDWLEVQGLLQPSDPKHPLRQFTPQQMLQRKKETEEKFHNDWANLNRYREENKQVGLPKTGENRVVFMGNSITAGWIRSHPEFFVSKSYVNRGIGGQTTPQMLIRFKQDVIDLKPKVVVILAGINDIAQNTGPTTLEATMDNISGMALLAKAHGIKTILSSVLPAYDFPRRPGLEPASKVITLNRMIKKFANENDMFYLDYFPALVDSRNGMKKEYSSDEVHPNLEAYKIMEPMVERAIETVLRKK